MDIKHLFTALLILVFSQEIFSLQPELNLFSEHSSYSHAVISPDGNYLAVEMKHDGGGDMVAILKADDMRVTTYIPPSGKKNPFNPQWISNNRIVVQLAKQWGTLEKPSANGELYAINVDGTQKRMLTRNKVFVTHGGSKESPDNDLDGYSELIHVLPEDEAHGFYNPKNTLKMYQKVLSFLDKHIGAH